MRADLAVVIPPSRRKRACALAPAGAEELDTARAATERRLAPCACAARDLYRGRQHRAMIGAVDALRAARPELAIDLFIVSAGYGLLREGDCVVPYEARLGGTVAECRRRGAALGLHAALSGVLNEAERVVFCLGRAYLEAAQLPLHGRGAAIFLAGQAMGWGPGAVHIAAGRAEARRLGSGEREVRAAVLALLCADVAREGWPALARIARGEWAVSA